MADLLCCKAENNWAFTLGHDRRRRVAPGGEGLTAQLDTHTGGWNVRLGTQIRNDCDRYRIGGRQLHVQHGRRQQRIGVTSVRSMRAAAVRVRIAWRLQWNLLLWRHDRIGGRHQVTVRLLVHRLVRLLLLLRRLECRIGHHKVRRWHRVHRLLHHRRSAEQHGAIARR